MWIAPGKGVPSLYSLSWAPTCRSTLVSDTQVTGPTTHAHLDPNRFRARAHPGHLTRPSSENCLSSGLARHPIPNFRSLKSGSRDKTQ
ncbi:hypothetical protein I79_006042 [Cricetulus griseus]|uniref:Uncharacterized protein n=1 Tax=Cricetulus griseus TaxID=10029 RepID=G3H6S3_CRIGR|nr:hypothetical protein I79_006042 [Cricetulus griseus]